MTNEEKVEDIIYGYSFSKYTVGSCQSSKQIYKFGSVSHATSDDDFDSDSDDNSYFDSNPHLLDTYIC